VITRSGRYKAFPILGTAVMALGLYLLSTMDVLSSRGTIFAYMFVLGLGLGMVMQVLVLAVQNAVDYTDLGVATSGATLFRSIGGSLGTAILGAIFASRLTSGLGSLLPAGAAAHAAGAGQVNPQQIAHLPAALRAGYLHAFTNALSGVFLLASAVALVAFALSWFIRELPLRETVTTGDLSDTYAAPRELASLVEVVNMIGRLDRREGGREIVTRIAARAEVDLSPAACWLLARLSDRDAPDIASLAESFNVEAGTLTAAREELAARALITPSADAPAGYVLSATGHATLQRLRETGERRLTDLLQCWRPDEHEELARLIAALAHEFFIDASALRSPVGA